MAFLIRLVLGDRMQHRRFRLDARGDMTANKKLLDKSKQKFCDPEQRLWRHVLVRVRYVGEAGGTPFGLCNFWMCICRKRYAQYRRKKVVKVAIHDPCPVTATRGNTPQ